MVQFSRDSALRDLGGGNIQMFGAIAIGGGSAGGASRLDPALSSFVSDRSAKPDEMPLLGRQPPAQALSGESRASVWPVPVAMGADTSSMADRFARLFDRPRHGERRAPSGSLRDSDPAAIFVPVREVIA